MDLRELVTFERARARGRMHGDQRDRAQEERG
jgi:hypothetical protein